MAATAGGYPYPVGTDAVRDGDNAIQALAAFADGRAGSFIDAQNAGTSQVGSGGWYTAALAVGDVVAERDPHSLLTPDGTGIVCAAGWLDILVQVKWNGPVNSANRRAVAWGPITGGPGTWAQSFGVAIPVNGGVQGHRDIVRNAASSRICALAYQDSGATNPIGGVRLVIRYLSAL